MSKPTLIEKWENVLRVLRGIAADPHERSAHFKMSTWGYLSECGTIACAAGHCALDPWFQERGFKGRIGPTDSWGTRQLEVESPYAGLWTSDLHVAVIRYFGPEGSQGIFFVTRERPVETVIREVEDYLEVLRSEDV